MTWTLDSDRDYDDAGSEHGDPNLAPYIAADTLPPANDCGDDTEPDVIERGAAQHVFSRALSELVCAIVQVPMLKGNRDEIAGAYMKVERLGMAACRALDGD